MVDDDDDEMSDNECVVIRWYKASGMGVIQKWHGIGIDGGLTMIMIRSMK